jgi:phage terminase large subunit-like protein
VSSEAYAAARAARGSSADARIAKRLVDFFGVEGAHEAVDEIVARFTTVELAALSAHWPMWGREKQLAPTTQWRSWGDLTARGWGKTESKTRFITDEVMAGRVRRIGLAAQSEAKTIDVQVYGLIEAAPPWFKPAWEVSSLELMWPNGASARAFTPEAPEIIRSENLDLAWLSEVQSWPAATREEAFSNFLFATRTGHARTIWDATPKKGHPLLKRLLARAVKNPDRHVVVRGTIYENPHLADGVVADMEEEYAGTRKGREELLGEMLEDSETAIFKSEWFTRHRRTRPDALAYRVIAVDPAVTSRRGSDTTGIVEVARGQDERAYVVRNDSGRHAVEKWGEIVLDRYLEGCDLVIAETNKGGDLVAQNLRALAKLRGLTVVVVGKEERPRRLPGTVFVKEVHARGAKEERAQPVATAYERGRVSHVAGGEGLPELEETLTTWEPAPNADSPGDLDAVVHGVGEILCLSSNASDPKAAFRGIGALGDALSTTPSLPKATRNIAALLGGGRSGRI